MNKKNGFTLIEIIVVILLLGAMVVIVVPNIVKTLNTTTKKLALRQENEIKNATDLYLTDYCKNPISKDYVCPFSYNLDSAGEKRYSGQLEIETLVNLNYIDEISLKSVDCDGYAEVIQDKIKIHLTCGNIYSSDD